MHKLLDQNTKPSTRIKKNTGPDTKNMMHAQAQRTVLYSTLPEENTNFTATLIQDLHSTCFEEL